MARVRVWFGILAIALFISTGLVPAVAAGPVEEALVRTHSPGYLTATTDSTIATLRWSAPATTEPGYPVLSYKLSILRVDQADVPEVVSIAAGTLSYVEDYDGDSAVYWITAVYGTGLESVPNGPASVGPIPRCTPADWSLDPPGYNTRLWCLVP